MGWNLLRTVLLVFGFTATSSASANNSIPENAWGTSASWYCNDGFRKTENSCKAIDIPDNAWAYADKWYCNAGYVVSGNQCLKPTQLPTKPTVDYYAEPIDVAKYKPIVSEFSAKGNSTSEDGIHTPAFGTLCAENGSCYGDISTETGRPKTVEVKGYYRKDGTYVRGHYRSKPKN